MSEHQNPGVTRHLPRNRDGLKDRPPVSDKPCLKSRKPLNNSAELSDGGSLARLVRLLARSAVAEARTSGEQCDQ